MTSCDFGRTKFTRCKLDFDANDSVFELCNFTTCDFATADLSRCSMISSVVTDSNIHKADLYKTSISHSSIENFISLGNVGANHRTIYYFYKEDIVKCGCFTGSLDKLIFNVNEFYTIENKYTQSYRDCIEVFKMYRNKYKK